MVSIRKAPLTDAECWHIIRRAEAARKSFGSPLLFLASQAKMVDQFKLWNNKGQLLVFEDAGGDIIGILAFDVGYDWWSEAKILKEEFVFCVSPTFKGFGRIALEELNRLAKRLEVDLIVSGCFFMKQPQIVTNMYRKNGFSEISPSYTKIM